MSAEKCYRRIMRVDFQVLYFLTCSASWEEDFAFVARLKQARPEVTVIAGGGFLVFKGSDTLRKNAFLDAVLLNFAGPDLRHFLDGESGVANIIYRRGGEIVEGERAAPSPFRIPVPRHELFPLRRYVYPVLLSHFTVVNSAVGCPRQCPFCIAAELPYRVRELDNVMEELQYVRGQGITRVMFGDLTFTVDRDRTMALCRAIGQEDLKLTWMCETRPDLLDKEILSVMKRAGCRAIHLGVESGDPETLERWKPGLTTEQVSRAFQLCRAMGIRTHAYFMIGLPEETEAAIRRTLDFARDLAADTVSFNLPMPHPGTAFGRSSGVEDSAFDERFAYGAAAGRVLQLCRASPARVQQLRRRGYVRFYLRPSYFWRRLRRLLSFRELWIDVRLFACLVRRTILTWSSPETVGEPRDSLDRG